MAVLRIVADLTADDPASTAAWYAELLGLDVKMDMGWIVTLGGSAPAPVHLSIASEGGSGAPVPHLSIEVDDLENVFANALELGAAIPYPLTKEPWGVQRFFVADPQGRILNILMHTDAATGA